MAIITLRIPKTLDATLENLATITGISKASLILYAINDLLRTNSNVPIQVTSSTTDDLTRTSLRLPDELKSILTTKANKRNTSVNAFILDCIHVFNLEHWSNYKRPNS